mmetsp:Transcript_70876/g.122796  ORF Transcript_70876/g.122796 Transcript_70876/m.122796 type:complete len:221 (-) Transcript_70876:678-1340(-)
MVGIVRSQVCQHESRIFLCPCLVIPQEIHQGLYCSGTNDCSLVLHVGDGQVPKSSSCCDTGASLLLSKELHQQLNYTSLCDGSLIGGVVNGKTAYGSSSCDTHPCYAVSQQLGEQGNGAGLCNGSLVGSIACSEAPQCTSSHYTSSSSSILEDVDQRRNGASFGNCGSVLCVLGQASKHCCCCLLHLRLFFRQKPCEWQDCSSTCYLYLVLRVAHSHVPQ